MQIINSLEIGGAERVAVNIAANLDPQKFSSSILTLERLGPFKDILDRQGIEYLSLFKKPGARPSLFFRIAAQIRAKKVDVVITHNYGSLFYGLFGAKIGGVRPVVHVDHNRMYSVKRKLLIPHNFLASKAYRIIAVSREIKEYLADHEGIKPEHIDIITNGIDESLFTGGLDRERIRRRLGIAPDRIVIGTGARLVPEKGLAHLLDAASLIRKRRRDFILVITGDGPLRNDLEMRARAHELQDHILFLGERTDFHEIIQALDIYVLPSISEGLPLSLLEAMAAGRAIVASRVGGIPDVLKDGENGHLVPPMEPHPLAAALEYLMDDPLKRTDLGEKAFTSFKEKHSAKKMADTYGLLIEKMMHAGRSSKG